MRTNLLIATLFALPSAFPAWCAGISAYPAAIQLSGRNATQTLAISAEDRDVTSECTFAFANQSLAKVSAQGVVSAMEDGKSSLTIRWKGERIVVPVTVAAAREEPK